MADFLRNQNDEKQLQRLAAQRRLYTLSENIFWAQIGLCGITVILANLVTLWWPSFRIYALWWGAFLLFLDHHLLRRKMKDYRNLGALIQEQFDCDVLQMPWDTIRNGREPDPELVCKYAQPNQKSRESLKDWYDVPIQDLPVHLGRLVCQRTNCVWDSELRKSYANRLLTIILCAFAAVFFIQIGNGASAVATALASLLPLGGLGLQQYLDHCEAAHRLKELKGGIEQLWNDALNEHTSAPEAELRARALQDRILDNRRKSPKVPDFFYKKRRERLGQETKAAVQSMIEKAKSAHAIHGL